MRLTKLSQAPTVTLEHNARPVDRWSSPVRPSRNKVEERHRNAAAHPNTMFHTEETMLFEHRPGVPLATLAPSPTPEPTSIVLSLGTIARPPLHQERPVWLDRPHRRAPDRFVPPDSAPSPKLSRSCWQSLSEQCRPCGGATPLWCQLRAGAPPCSGSPSATTSNRLPSNLLGSVRSTSRTNTFKRTRAPPSLQTLAAADSNAQPLRPSTPAVAQAARWWQSKSSKEQHTERRGVNPRQPTRWKRDERAACQWTTL